MTIKNLNNISIPNQSSVDTTQDEGFTKVQSINSRLYSGLNKLAHRDEFSEAEETNPSYTYSSGNLSRIDYNSGNYKLFTYDLSGNLVQLDFVKGLSTYRKILSYDANFNLINIAFSIL